jgi:hypothetical protein
LFIGFKGGGVLSAAHSLRFLVCRDNLVDDWVVESVLCTDLVEPQARHYTSGYFAPPQVLMSGHSASVRLQQVVRAALPTVARYFGLPVALHFTTTVSVPLTVTIWLAAARGDKVA